MLTILLDSTEEEQGEPFGINVMYPTDISGTDRNNTDLNYYFLKKDQFKTVDDIKSVKKKQKIILPLDKGQRYSNSYLILEFTNVFRRPRFCSHSREQIFGSKCPYYNW